MTIRIITDSTSEIKLDTVKKLNIDIIPLKIIIDQKTYFDNIDISTNDFYLRLNASNTPITTSQANPHDFLELFQRYADKGDIVIGIFLSSKLSGTLQSANIAKNIVENNENIHIIDSLCVTSALGLLVRCAVKMRDENIEIEKIIKQLNEIKTRIKLVAYVDTLKYLKMGGRISSSAAFVGETLNISPILALNEGSLSVIKKIRGKNKVFNYIKDYTIENNIDFSYPIAFASSDNLKDLTTLLNDFSISDNNLTIDELGPAICCHSGLKAFGIAFISKKA